MTLFLDPPVVVDGGWRVRETDRYFVDVMVMLFGNLRIVIVPKDQPWSVERGWCYSNDDLIAVILRCGTFDPDAGGEPEGWVKEVGTERRPCAARFRPANSGLHERYIADCPDCGP